MNKSNLKRYAPQARKYFIAAVIARAQLLGLNLAGAHGKSAEGGAQVLATGPIGAQPGAQFG